MGRRPADKQPPAYLSKNPPVPAPAPVKDDRAPLDPTRFGDWTIKGVAVDF